MGRRIKPHVRSASTTKDDSNMPKTPIPKKIDSVFVSCLLRKWRRQGLISRLYHELTITRDASSPRARNSLLGGNRGAGNRRVEVTASSADGAVPDEARPMAPGTKVSMKRSQRVSRIRS